LFVTLDALYVEGLVHITELGGEYYRFDEARLELRGERTGIRYGVGTRVRVQVSRVDLDGRKIDFRMVRDADTERLIGKGRGPAPALAAALTAASVTEELGALREKDRAVKAGTRDAKARLAKAGKGVKRVGGVAVVRGNGGSAVEAARRSVRQTGAKGAAPKAGKAGKAAKASKARR
jgi:ribonuclease R